MTREEAIEVFKKQARLLERGFSVHINLDDALAVAIKLLEQEPCEGRMKYVQETVNTIMDSCKTDSIKDKCFRNAARFIQNAIDGSNPEFELINDAESCEDCISRKSLKYKLQEHHDFFVNAYGGFSNLPQNDKSRVDEITNCIAMVVKEPPVIPKSKTGHWKFIQRGKFIDILDEQENAEAHMNFCECCGAKMESEG